MRSSTVAATAVGLAVGVFAPASAFAATRVVDDNKIECPGAGYTTVQSAVDASAANDTVVICKGTYVEGSGAVGTNALSSPRA